jgi:hypothetical protein
LNKPEGLFPYIQKSFTQNSLRDLVVRAAYFTAQGKTNEALQDLESAVNLVQNKGLGQTKSLDYIQKPNFLDDSFFAILAGQEKFEALKAKFAAIH